MRHDIDDRVLERYCAGDCSPPERAEVERWIGAEPSRRAYVELLKAAWQETGAADLPPERPDLAAAWKGTQRRLGWLRPSPAAGAGRERLDPWRRRSRWPGLAAAAALVVAVGASVLVTYSARDAATRPASEATAMREVVTRRGQRAALDLPDGSRVIVAAESRLRIPAAYHPTTGAREVYLEGEAFFEVTHDSTRPFRVHAANGIAEDLGTEFVVIAYPETKGMQVVVASGVVALHAADPLRVPPRPLLTLTPGDLGRLDSAGTATLTRGVAVEPYVSWMEGRLVFEGATLREVIPRLARWYDLEIRLADRALADRRLTATFRDETVPQVLELLALSLDVRVERNERIVLLSPRR